MSTTKATAATMQQAGPVDLSHHFSRENGRRAPSMMKGAYKYFKIPGIRVLSGGLPNASYFPFETLESSTAMPQRFKPTPSVPVDPPSTDQASKDAPSSHVVVPTVSPDPNILRKIDVKTALQYGTAEGYPPLYAFITEFVREHFHPNIPYAGGPGVILTCGSTDGFSKTINALSDIWDPEKDWVRERQGILCEKFAYMNAIQAVAPRGLNIAPVEIDDEGMIATGKGGLADVLENWDFSKGKRPHLLYTVTVGQNPTSGTLSVQRRKDLYALCKKYDVIIIEDDPYWYLQFPSAIARSNKYPKVQNYNAAGRSSGFEFLDSLIPSYLSVDTDGRVVRLDTFSKTVAPGCRVGWITAQPKIVECILRITETSTQQPSGFVQALLSEMLMGPSSSDDNGRGGAKNGTGWKFSGWVRWIEGLRGEYERRMNKMCTILDSGAYIVNEEVDNQESALDEWSLVKKTTLLSFDWPVGGMFVWVRVHFENHPLFGQISPTALSKAYFLFLTSKPYLVLVATGTVFAPTQKIRDEEAWRYFRLCFAAVDVDQLEESTEAYVKGTKDFFKIKDVKDLPIDEDEMATDSEEDMLRGLSGLSIWGC